MRVTLLDYTRNAERLLIFTKNTRLGLNQEQASLVGEMESEVIQGELAYMANTIPSSWEFAGYTFLIEDVSRAFTHQFVRNRTGSYAQESLRVTDKCEFKFVMPDRIAQHPEALALVQQWIERTSEVYSVLKALDIPTEDCRSVLPTNCATNIVARFNLRSLVDLVKSRLGGRTQKEYQRVARAMVDEVTKVHPWAELFFFGDQGRDYFKEIEEFAEREYGGDLLKKGELLKIVDKMRQK